MEDVERLRLPPSPTFMIKRARAFQPTCIKQNQIQVSIRLQQNLCLVGPKLKGRTAGRWFDHNGPNAIHRAFQAAVPGFAHSPTYNCARNLPKDALAKRSSAESRRDAPNPPAIFSRQDDYPPVPHVSSKRTKLRAFLLGEARALLCLLSANHYLQIQYKRGGTRY
jgi:hypothetical protein